MDYDPELEFYLSEMFGDWDADVEDHTASLEKSTGAIDRFFEKSPSQPPVEQLNDSDLSALNGLSAFLKAEKQKVPGMNSQEIRHSVSNVLRKAADVLAAI